MVITKEQKAGFVRKLIASRTRMLCNHGFYGMLLMHLPFMLDESITTAATDGKAIYFSPNFLSRLTNSELDFVLMHEVLHVVLRHINRSKIFEENPILANIACDIVVNSNILYSCSMKISSISVDGTVSMHLTPNGDEGYLYTAEEVYNMLNVSNQNAIKAKGRGRKGNDGEKSNGESDELTVDDHSKWESLGEEEKQEIQENWEQHLRSASQNIRIKESSNNCGNIPLCAQRVLQELSKAQTDWRTLLTDFVQEEVLDYSFNPPDKRYSESDFFIPDFNVSYDLVPGNVLFMIDTSGSVSDDMIARAYSEIKGAIDQFDGKITGHLGFFDASVVPAQPFVDLDTLLKILPRGGGGTSFHAVFDYVDSLEEKPTSIVILTDGEARFPKEERAKGIPVLWLIIDNKITPPWGKTARVTAV